MQTRSTDPIITATDVERRVGSQTILAPVSFEVRPGVGLAVAGPNGSGKTTLLRIILGRDKPSAGTIITNGQVSHGPVGIASVTGSPPFYEDLTVAEHLELIQASWGGPEVTGSYMPILERLNLTRILHQFPAELSSGERQMAGLSFALLRPAAVIVLDEPEQRLDGERRTALGELLLERMNRGTAVIMASHDPELTQKVADARITLKDRV
jgi:ABC-2 type transport system ATP-binding protein